MKRRAFTAVATIKFTNTKSNGYTYKTVKRPVVETCPVKAHAKVSASSITTLALNTFIPREFHGFITAELASLVIKE